MPRERGEISIKLATFTGLLNALNPAAIPWRSAVRARRGDNPRAWNWAFVAAAGVETRTALRVTAMAAALGGLVLLGTWWAHRGRFMAPRALTDDPVLAPRRPLPRAGASAKSARQPAPAQRGSPASTSIPESYRILMTRSVFALDGHAASDASRAAAPRRSGFLLKGISQEDQRFTAFVADAPAGSAGPAAPTTGPSAAHVVQVHVGDTLPGGRVRQITLDSVAVETEGRVVRIQVGQKFDASASAELQASTR